MKSVFWGVMISLAAIAAMAFTTACSPIKDDKKVAVLPAGINEDGRCTGETVNAINDIKIKSALFSATSDVKLISEIQASCAAVRRLTDGETCQAMDVKTGKSVQTSYQDVSADCRKIDAAASAIANTNTIQPQTVGADDWRSITQVKGGVSIYVKDETTMSVVAISGRKAYIQNGTYTSDFDSLDKAKGFCHLETVGDFFSAKPGYLATFSSFSELDGGNYLSATSGQVNSAKSDTKLRLTCYKTLNIQWWTVQDLKNVFGAAADIVPAN